MKNRPAIGSTQIARRLRLNPTDAAIAIWRLLRLAFPEARFRRQVPIRSLIADFASHSAKTVIEIDGGQHAGEQDAQREAEGYRLLRFWNNDVLGNPEGVHSVICSALNERHPQPASPIKGEE